MPTEPGTLASYFTATRAATERLCAGLEPEDLQLQAMPDASPVKWHLAHTTWFFETFLLIPRVAGYRPFHPRFAHLFNSYYEAVGSRHPRPERGLLSRPTVAEVFEYRRAVDRAVSDFLSALRGPPPDDVAALVALGVNHEQQHQELILTDLKAAFARNPLHPVYRSRDPSDDRAVMPGPEVSVEFPGGLVEVGHGGDGFAFDNEGPRHTAFLRPFAVSSRLVTNGEYTEFMADGGYQRPELWLSDGWSAVNTYHWDSPLYWHRDGKNWLNFTLSGLRPVNPAEPVAHVSFYEADAFARWAGGRLPTEHEWEVAARDLDPMAGHFADDGRFHPRPLDRTHAGWLNQLFGDVWEWTASPYIAYPGYRPAAGALGEYNGKFMCNQMVLRGGSCASPRGHLRPTYRNFFPPEARWQLSGIRLAKDA